MSVAIILSLVLLGLVLLLALVLPSVTSPTVPFGVRVPAEHAGELTVTRQARIYRRRVLIGGLVVAGVGVGIFALTGQPVLLPLSVLALVGLWYGCFYLANQEIRAAKAAGRWFEGRHQGIAVDIGLRTEPLRFPWLWLAPAIIITVGTGVAGVLLYPSMPDVLAVHYGAKGLPDRVTVKSVGTAFSLVFMQIGLTALFAAMAAAIVRSRPDIDPARPVGSADWYRRYKALSAKAVLGLVAMIDVAMLGSSVLMWTGTVTPWAPLVIAFPILAAVVVLVLVLARNNRDRGDVAEPETGLTHRDDDRFWRGGLFYINREDRALLVPRRFGLGWTVNLGNPRTAMLLAGLLALITLVIVLRFDG
ncbi:MULTISPECIES: DUF1648 domain-containing protein [unclassified Cryobacterium]|uniref:DUF1648 domain-containing protein n=1 Tax=unclassified Cryobacterium TaxID=2649013 RepID=UPI00106B3249|nr:MULTISPECIES: DUF5808 domain-containing protein [unclassified Cryobacterium]TFB94418.1 DUF1648 domain-containing protein [Cryobacterium sp. MDB2-A-1]TFC07555.1 DUF1648 domain-containing protein [Cryobacterium sp. MDB2-33-2]TFC13854.1 DUF1648 domain-containing protein [Cryobacterium sp. MDB2-A-2]TFC23498.1 DUF1648 domain-containing protein [Cryobacterium sp. MDB2-10]TFC31769.1 DUF1648 domain-containing protein [Cryobacterium sp. MDB1-18-2]